jgi:hypothetical protein
MVIRINDTLTAVAEYYKISLKGISAMTLVSPRCQYLDVSTLMKNGC